MFRVTKQRQNDRQCWINSWTHQQRPSPNNPWAHRHCWDQLWNLPGDLNRKFEHAPHCSFSTTMCPPTRAWTTKFEPNNNMVIIPHPTYLALCDFALFPKLKMKLKGQHFETVSDFQRESQAVLDSIKENDFQGCFWSVEKMMGLLCMFPRRLFWRRWQPKPSKSGQHFFFFYVVRELSDSTLHGAQTRLLII
jgi:hypothetical protein